MCAQKPLHEGEAIALFLYKEPICVHPTMGRKLNISMLVVQRAFRITMKARERMKRQMKVSFDRKCKILCRASHFVGGRFTYICTYVDREYFEMIVAHCNPHAKKIFFCYKYSNAN